MVKLRTRISKARTTLVCILSPSKGVAWIWLSNWNEMQINCLRNWPALPHAVTHASTVRLPRGRGTGRLTALRGIARADLESLRRCQMPFQNIKESDILVEIRETPRSTRGQICASRPNKERAVEWRSKVIEHVIHGWWKVCNSTRLDGIPRTSCHTSILQAFVHIILEAWSWIEYVWAT